MNNYEDWALIKKIFAAIILQGITAGSREQERVWGLSNWFVQKQLKQVGGRLFRTVKVHFKWIHLWSWFNWGEMNEWCLRQNVTNVVESILSSSSQNTPACIQAWQAHTPIHLVHKHSNTDFIHLLPAISSPSISRLLTRTLCDVTLTVPLPDLPRICIFTFVYVACWSLDHLIMILHQVASFLFAFFRLHIRLKPQNAFTFSCHLLLTHKQANYQDNVHLVNVIIFFLKARPASNDVQK